MNARLLFLHALSPLHAGTGQGVGVIDLPIAREKATGLPYLPGSSLKGTLREHFTGDEALRVKVFGPDTASASEHAGSAQFSDQRLLLLPVRSLLGTFAWATSPYVLRRFARDARETEASGVPDRVPEPQSGEHCVVVEQGCALGEQQVVLEDLDLKPQRHALATQWAAWLGERLFPDGTPEAGNWRAMLSARFCLVHDDLLTYLLQTATEVIARVKLQEDAKTVKKGGLWYEEALPAETVLAGLVVATPVRATADEVFAALQGLAGRAMQFGGKATVGRGLCRLQLG